MTSQLKKDLTTKIVEFCAKDVRPMEIISGQGFTNLAQFLIELGATHGNIVISTILPHPTTVSRHVADVKKDWHAKLFPVLKKAVANDECSSTSDMWTDKYKINPFLVMTAHFFDDNFVLEKHVLFTSKFSREDKTGINILKELKERFENLGFKKDDLKKIRFVTDHGSNMVAALKDSYMRDDCRAHRLNTILANTFESEDLPLIILKILRSCKNIVRHLKQSGKANQLAKAVVQECETRWNAKLGMIQSIVSNYTQVMELLTENQYKKWCFDVHLAEQIVRFLTPFEEATKLLEGDTYPTACKVLLCWEDLSNHLKEENFVGWPMISLVRIARKFFHLKYPIDMNNKVACFLDPRYRFLKMLPEVEREEVYIEVKHLLRESPQPQLEDVLQATPAKKSRFSVFEESLEDFKNIDEFELYMQTANYTEYLDTQDTKKHLVELFWRNNKYRFPKLYRLAKRRLHVPASSGPSERVFSDAGRVYDKTRSNTKPQLMDDLLFLKANLAL